MTRPLPVTLLTVLLVAVLPRAIAAQQIPGDQSNPKMPRAVPRDIYASAASGDLDRVKLLLSQGVNINQPHPKSHETPLIAALRKDRVEVATFLLDSGADVTPEDRVKTTALHMAAHWGRTELVERILALGGDIDSFSNEGRQAIHYATRRGHIDTMKVLIAHGADLHPISGFGNAPIDLAFQLSAPTAANLLIEAGARLTDDPDRAINRMAIIVQKDWVPIVEHMFDEAASDPELTARLTNAAYDAAVGPGHHEVLEVLAKRGAGVSDRTVAGVSRLFQACAIGSEPLVIQMLDSGLDPNEVSQPSGWTPLHAAMLSGRMPIVELLLQHGASVRVTDGLARTPLHIAVALELRDIVNRLLREGADPTAAAYNGDTPLHYAAHTGNRAIAEALMNAGASADVKNDDGLTPFEIAESIGKRATFDSLHRPPTPAPPPPPGVEVLVRAYKPEHGGLPGEDFRAHILSQIARGTPVFHLAVSCNALTAIEELLGASPELVNERDAYGYQPLHKAAEVGNAAVLALLLSRGADVNDAQNAARWTPLHFAASAGNTEIVRRLLDNGADRSAVDGNGLLPSDVARSMARPELEQLLR